MNLDWIDSLADTGRSLTLRRAVEADLDFLERLYASTRRDELAQLDWDDERKRAFLAQQFRAQHAHYRAEFANASFLIIERHSEAIGRIYLDHRRDEIRLIDIALVPEARNRGFGTSMMDRLLAAAGRLGLPVRLHVESFNPAYRLYERLGFKWLEDRGVYQFMEWSPRAR